MTKKIRWVIAHEPIDLFLRAAENFSQEVYDATNGKFDIEILSLTDYSIKYNNGQKITKHDLIKLMEEGVVEMSQMYTYVLGNYNKDFWALDMPFLIEDHQHADAILEGPIGKGMLNRLAETSRVRGLAFTYSGGYKCLPTNVEFTTMSDFKNKRIRTSNSPVSRDTFTAIGAIPVSLEVEQLAQAGNENVVDAGESTYIRILPLKQEKAFAQVSNTEHSLLMTSIIIGDDFWNSLTAEEQKVIGDAAFRAARTERRESVENAEDVKELLGTRNTHLTAEDQVLFQELTAPLYDKYRDFFSSGLLDEMIEAGKSIKE